MISNAIYQAVIILVLVLMAPAAIAESHDIRIGLILASDHHQETGERKLNESNPGIFGSVNGWTMAAYVNSFNEQSVMLGHEWRHKRWKYGELATSLGVVNGYDNDPDFGGDYRVWAALSFRFGPAKYWYAGAVSVLGLEHQIQ